MSEERWDGLARHEWHGFFTCPYCDEELQNLPEEV